MPKACMCRNIKRYAACTPSFHGHCSGVCACKWVLYLTRWSVEIVKRLFKGGFSIDLSRGSNQQESADHLYSWLSGLELRMHGFPSLQIGSRQELWHSRLNMLGLEERFCCFLFFGFVLFVCRFPSRKFSSRVLDTNWLVFFVGD